MEIYQNYISSGMNGGNCTAPAVCSCPPGYQGRHCEGGKNSKKNVLEMLHRNYGTRKCLPVLEISQGICGHSKLFSNTKSYS